MDGPLRGAAPGTGGEEVVWRESAKSPLQNGKNAGAFLDELELVCADAHEAEDLTQSVFLEIYRRAGQFDARRGTLKVWLLQYAYSRSINRRNYLLVRHFYSRLEDDAYPNASQALC